MLRPPIDEPLEIPAAAQEACDAVCQAVEDWNEQPEMLAYLQAYDFKADWFTAWRYVKKNSRCGQLIVKACEALVAASGVFIAAGQHGGKSGYIYPPEQIIEYDGKFPVPGVLRWPCGHDMNGTAIYDCWQGEQR